MDLNVIKQRLSALNDQNSQNGGTDYAANFWKPEIGKSVIRIVPSMYDVDNPFTELKFHNVISKYPILALSNFGQQDPVEEFIKQLREIGGKDNWSLSGKLTPRSRYFVPVIVRGEEEKGVRLWNIGVTMYKSLLQLAADDEIGDFTDITTGTDMNVEKIKGDPYPEITIRARRSSSPLSDDPKLVEKWLSNQPRPVDCFRHADYEYVKKQLESYLTGGSAAPAQVSNPVVEAGEKVLAEQKADLKLNVAPAAAPKPVAKPAPQSAPSKFEDLFGDDNSGDEDNLPF